MGATRRLAEFVAETAFEQLPREVIHESKRCVLNYLGVALGARQEETARILERVAEELGGREHSTILGSSRKTSAVNAALINGSMSHVFDYDDTDLGTVIHPTGPVLSAAMPLAEWKGRSGKRLLASLALGMEVELRVGAAVYPSHYDVGWHITGTAGVFGAAAAAGWLLGLDAGRLSQALGLAGTQASGFREMFGYMAKAMHVGKAAANGLWSALLAGEGFTASDQVLEAKRGFCSVTAAEHDLARATDGLGSEYLLLRNGLKPYACGVVTHPTIDGVRRLRERHNLQPHQVTEIETRVHPLVLELTGKKEPRTGLESKFSIYYCAAIALLEGNARQSQFTDAKVRRPDVLALMGKVKAEVDPSIHESQAEVSIRTVDGRTLKERVESATGTPANPLTDSDLVAKFMDLVEGFLPRDQAERLIEDVWRLDRLPSVKSVVELAAP